MEAGLRASKSKPSTALYGEGKDEEARQSQVHEKKAKPSSGDGRKKNGTALSGLIVYLGLVLFAYCLGMAVPNTSKSLPVPSHVRTFCQKKPEEFDREAAKGKKVLITGAAGFMGSYLARHCAENLQMDVVGLDDYSRGTINIPFLSDIRIVKGDLSNSTFLAGLFAKHQFDIVYHTSQVGGSALSHHHPAKIYETNLMGTVNLVSQVVSSKTPRFVLLSSTGVYGTAEGPWAETTMPKPSDPAGISRMAAEQHVRSAGEYYGLDYIILRMHSIYGPHMDFSPSRSSVVARAIQAVAKQNAMQQHHATQCRPTADCLWSSCMSAVATGAEHNACSGIVPHLILTSQFTYTHAYTSKAVAGTPLTIHGAGTQKRQFTYVGDLAQLVAQAAFLKQREFHVINIGSDEINSVSELVSEVEAVSGRSLDVSKGGDRTGTYHVQVVHDRSRCIFGADMFTTLKQGLQETYTWAAGPDLPTRLHSLPDFQAEILETGGGGLATMEHGTLMSAEVTRALQDANSLVEGTTGTDRYLL